jgi:hypothetical protein
MANTKGDVFTSRAPQPLDLIPKDSPLDWRAQAKRRDAEAMEFVQQHFRETGFLPKEYEMRRASDPAFNKAEAEAATAQFLAAMERLRAWEAYWRDVYQFNIRHHTAWSAVWTEQAVRDSLGGTMKSLLNLPQVFNLQEAIKKPGRKTAEQITQLKSELRDLQPTLDAHVRRVTGEIDALIRHITDPHVGPVRTAEYVQRFLQSFDVGEPNLINKLSELVCAKALWFANDIPLRLLPGPAAVDGSDSPDYVNDELLLVGDNFRIGGIKTSRTTVVLNPDAQTHQAKMQEVKQAVKKGIRDKFDTYREKWLDGKGYRVVVTVDVSNAPWVLNPEPLQEIQNSIDIWLPTINGQQFILEVFLIVSGIPRRIWPRH